MHALLPSESSLAYRCALITGASSGLGVEFARQLAPTCQCLILIARRKDELEKVAKELCDLRGELTVHCIVADLSEEEERIDLVQKVDALGEIPDLLVNNAGMGDFGEFETSDWSKINAMIQVNITALTHLCRSFLPDMIAQNQGAVINMSSLASVLPIPDFAVYAATKAYVSSFSEALRMELRQYGIPVLSVCPGPVHTGFGEIAMRDGGGDGLPAREGFYTSSEKVVSDALRALKFDRARVYPGWKIALLAAGVSVLPMAVIRAIQIMRRGK